MEIKSKKLFDLFVKYRSRKFIFIKPGGNWGDELIHMGANKLASTAGIDYETLSWDKFLLEDFSSEHVLYVHGGGGFNNIWTGDPIRAFKKAITTHLGVLILGPTTFECSDGFLNATKEMFKVVSPSKVYIFCRGNISYQNLSKIVPSEVVLDQEHDTALNLLKSDLIKIKKSSINKNVLYAIREDKESTPISKYNPFFLWFDPIKYAKTFDEWVAMHEGVNEIVTNRLHSAILGTILGKEVILLPNSYHKNRGLWEFSLQDLGVRWKDNIYPEGILRFLMRFSLYRWLVDSYKIKHAVIRFYLSKTKNL